MMNLDNEQLLIALDKERVKFTKSNKTKMREMIDELIARKVYPAETVPGNPNTVYTMVECYGARWHEWREPLNCPACKVDLRCHRTGPPFKREIGVYSREQDRTTHYKCPDCNVIIPR